MNTKKFSLMTVATICGLALLTPSATGQSSPWAQKVHTLVKANFSYPRSAQLRKEQGMAVIRVEVASDGMITRVTLTQSSGSAILDREALRIAEKMKRLPVPPRGTTTISLPISFRLG